MIPLPRNFRKNGLPYQLIKWNEEVALFGVGGTYTDKILHYEVCKMHYRSDKYGDRQSIPSNEQFGRDGSLAFLKIQEALVYFEELTNKIKSCEKPKNHDKSGMLNYSADWILTEG